MLLLAPLLLLACDEPPLSPPEAPWWEGAARTDTTPDFHGRVPRNLLMVSIDTFRKDHLDLYSDRERAPFLSALARRGFVLDDHTQCSNWTFASTVCTLRGTDTVDGGFIPRLSRMAPPVPADTPFLAGWLADAGFHTVLVSGNAWISPSWGTTQGYDVVRVPHNAGARHLFELGAEAVEAAVGGDEPWFLHIHLIEPHAPYDPPSAYLTGLDGLPPVPWDLSQKAEHYDANLLWPNLPEEARAALEQHLRVRYEGEIRWLDDQLAAAFSDLARRGLLRDTLVVFWTDHGEQFWEHGYQSHAYTLHGEEVDGVAFFWAENIVPGRFTEPTAAIDLVPTLLTLWDLPVPPEVTGLPVGSAPADRPRFATAAARLGVVQMVERQGLKLTYSWLGAARLYDRRVDPHEQHDLFDPDDPRARALWSLLEPYAERAEPWIPDRTRTAPPGW